MGVLSTPPQAFSRSRMSRLPCDRAIGRPAAPVSLAIRANDTPLPDRAIASAEPTGPPPTIATSTSARSTSGRSPAPNQGLDVAYRFRRGGREHLASGRRHGDVVFDAHADVPQRLGDLLRRADVASRLHGKRHPGLKAAPFPARLVFPGVVNVQPQPMPRAVHV